MAVKRKRLEFENREETLEQWDFADLDDMSASKQWSYAASIGYSLMAFSEVEMALDVALANTINDRAHDPGYRIIKFLKYGDKWKLLRDQHQNNIGYLNQGRAKTRLSEQLEILIDDLENVGQFRNKIAHANWMTLSDDGFVRVGTKEDPESNTILFRKVKMSPKVLDGFIRRCGSLTRRLDEFGDKIWEVHNREDRRWMSRTKKSSALVENKKKSA